MGELGLQHLYNWESFNRTTCVFLYSPSIPPCSILHCNKSLGGLHHIASWVGAHRIGERVKKGGNGQLGMERIERVSVKIKKKKRKS